ncbi:MFS transporter [Paenibacillus sp. JCM 10914]|uniref:MFS transporter n=1 Tax=Paenibacillus sp. JCM 10914 TaxID=1236974 RepID=UPI0003CC4675|nr:MFS transporter [Paenibacillus sp. JCM 10914]GAE05491.1 antibiotic efflux protein [Paenibacillus sp. JCM 10914]
MKSTLIYKNTDFLKIWLGKIILLTGNQFSALVIPWIVLHQTHSPLTTALITICSQIAPVIFALPAGTFIERRNKKQVVILSDAVRVLTMLVMIFLAYHDWLSITALAVLMSVLGFAGLTQRISFNSMIPALVGRKNLLNAHNYLEGADAVSLLIGPVLAGLVLTHYGIVYTLSIEMVAITLSLLSVLLITNTAQYDPPAELRLMTRGIRGFIQDIHEGFGYILNHPIQRLMTMYHFSLNFTAVFISLMIVIYSQQQLKLDVVQAGLLMTGMGIGNLIGVFLLSRIQHWNWHLLLSLTLAISGIGITLIMVSQQFAVAFIGAMLFDGGLSMAFVVHGSLSQAITSDRYLARISSTRYVISSIASVIGTAIAGLISEYVSSTFAMLFSIVLIMLTVLLIMFNRLNKQAISALKPID